MIGTLDHALNYLSQGIPPIPANPKTKAPLVKWTEYQTRLPTKEEVIAMFKQFPKCMISVVTGKVSNLVVIDADSPEAVQKIEEHLPDSYETVIDISPRGGRHYWFQMNGVEYQSKSGIFEKCDIKCNGGVLCVPPSVNDTGGQYRFLNSLNFERSMLHPMPESLSKFLQSLSSSIYNKTKTQDVCQNLKYFEEGTRDDNLFTVANGLIKSGINIVLITEVLKRLILSWGEKPDEKWIQDKIQSALSRVERKERNLSAEVHDWVLSTSGVFLSTELYNCLQLSTREDKKNVSIILKRLSEENIIERSGNKNGCFRKLDINEEVIDYVNVKTTCLDIKFPFQIEDYVRIMPKNVIVIAGEPDAGKTAFLLNLVKMNMDKNEIFYFSSEMGSLELQDRLKNFDHPINEWRFKPIERSNDFADVIRPDAVNIIDFLEISDNFYQVSGLIKSIYDKLDKGIAIIALQKNKGTDFGLGGMRSLEKPRLYLSMEPGKLKIIKAKNWVSADKNPNKLSITYKLYKGCHFTPISGWLKPND